MAFRDFSFPQVQEELGLSVYNTNLFEDISEMALRAEFLQSMKNGTNLANAINTEKAKSEFIIAPVLLELYSILTDKFKLFSGLEWNVDSSRGLNGYCDFILTKGQNQFVLAAPFIAVAEAKNDNIHNGLGQCIAAMYAAQLSNSNARVPIKNIHGVVSSGGDWKFLKLEGAVLTIDIADYYIHQLPKIMGILKHIVLSVEI